MNHQIVYQLQDVFNLLPDVSKPNFVDSLYVKTNDQMLVSIMSLLLNNDPPSPIVIIH